MSALRFARVIANSVHECAPDRSTHIIGVGELREAVAEMEALYEALVEAERVLFDLCPRLPHDGPSSPEQQEEYERIGFPLSQATAALRKARGDLVDPLEQVRS